MKRFLQLFLFQFLVCQLSYSQGITNQGKIVGEIYTDFHYNFNDSSKTNGFGLNRAYLGYKYTPEGNWSSLVMINVGTPEDLAPGSVSKRYAYLREVSVSYNLNKLTVNFGMVSTRIFDFQQGFWGKRYLGPEFQATYGYGSVADLGIVVDYKMSDVFKFDLSVLNGKGYTNIQYDNSIKAAAGLTITTPDRLFVRLYADLMKPHGIWQVTSLAFAGIKNDLFSFGAEASYKTNLDYFTGHDVWGLSATGSIFLNAKTELFCRYDYMSSLTIPVEDLQWDHKVDGTFLIAGIQRYLNNNLKIALNYRSSNPYEPGKKTCNALYVNADFKF